MISFHWAWAEQFIAEHFILDHVFLDYFLTIPEQFLTRSDYFENESWPNTPTSLLNTLLLYNHISEQDVT